MSLRKDPDGGQRDLFLTYLTDLPLRDQRETMERPFFSLAKRKRLKPIEYKSPDRSVEITVSANERFGIATIWDADILIWAASQITDRMNRYGPNDLPGPTLHCNPYDVLKSIRRNRSGGDYEDFKAALDRLTHTAIQIKVRGGRRRVRGGSFHWIDQWQYVSDGEKADGIVITLSKWVYEGIVEQGGVLSIHPDYFLITSAIGRWLYRVARKHAGDQPAGWTCAVDTLHAKSGSERDERRFRYDLKALVVDNSLPEYSLSWIERTESGVPAVHMVRRSKLAVDQSGFEFPRTKRRTRPALVTSEG